MTHQSLDSTHPRRRHRLIGLLLVFALVLAACGTSTETGSPVTFEPVLIEGDLSEDGPQYGDSIEEWSAATDPNVTVEPDGTLTMSVSSQDAESGHLNVERLPEAGEGSEALDAAIAAGFDVVEWTDLVAPGFTAEEVYARYEDRLLAIDDLGSPEYNAVYEEMAAEYESGAKPNAELDGDTIQLAGFVAPLSFDEDKLTEFLLVPYFGACIHVPPPPPHQTILVTLAEGEGLDIDDSYGAVWVTGTLTISDVETDLAEASYTLTGGSSRVFQA